MVKSASAQVYGFLVILLKRKKLAVIWDKTDFEWSRKIFNVKKF